MTREEMLRLNRERQKAAREPWAQAMHGKGTVNWNDIEDL